MANFLEWAVASGLPGVSVTLATRAGVEFAEAQGLGNLQQREPLQTTNLFGIGSITKVFVAVLILQLIEEGRIQTSDTPLRILGDRVKPIRNAGHATVMELLSHTSGIPSWEDDARWIREGRGIDLDPKRIWPRESTLEYVYGAGETNEPGARYRYSNSNYTLLGLMIEEVTGSTLLSELSRRIFVPLGLSDIYLEGFQAVPVGRLPHRYHWATPEFEERAGICSGFARVTDLLIDATGSNLSVEWAAGGLVSTMTDLAAFGVALRDGRLLTDASMTAVKQWTSVRDLVQVGHNVFRWEVFPGTHLLGHDGDVLGFSASLYWLENLDLVVAAAANVGAMHAGEVRIRVQDVVKSPEFILAARTLVEGRG